ncbi:MAG: redoxin family protein, partial [Planctomycetia bacterium]
MIRFAAAFAIFAAVSAASADLKVGDAMPAFASLETAAGTKISSDDVSPKDVVVVCVTCNKCPVAVAYEDRMVGFAKKYKTSEDGSKVGFVAINVNNNEADGLPAMKERAEEKGFNFPYAFDPSQKSAKALGAKVTPHFF